jgi:hypothetical protein
VHVWVSFATINFKVIKRMHIAFLSS